ncbi:DUF4251 domain-containing protein [Flavitalea sp. BT771]|uniref:DUF4251 domain-containing protein n=1 Tax=Flavitalea sp. BT771 TaxID=3063329 RepID=UPI0026E37409|nr:DUF4251 domain-containing protein [Flavitalea sp. BT771]MDO6430720.1 DUF4251 domain-containing protein [Flavitalea sp. BT771]MDV6219140.1 DUF4251 domain-containing protein [Flavitalea sp. BT771]
MNIKPIYSICILALLALTSLPGHMNAQDTKQDKKAAKAAAIKSLVDSQTFVFAAQTALPMSGRTRQLTSDYDLRVTKSSVISYLPYFGRAYQAPLDPSKGGIQFTSKDFEYTATPGKKGGWTILVKPRDYRDVQQMTLSISDDGYGTLQVISTNRQPISFNGYIRAPSKGKKS